MTTELRRVYVKWIDSYGCTARWEELDRDYPLLVIESIGFVILNNDDVIAIANSVSQETSKTPAQANGIMTIPKLSIIELNYLVNE